MIIPWQLCFGFVILAHKKNNIADSEPFSKTLEKFTIELSNTCFPFMSRHGGCAIHVDLYHEAESQRSKFNLFQDSLKTN